MNNYLQRLFLRYRMVPETPEIVASEYTVERVNYSRVGLIITIAVIAWGIFFWQVASQGAAMILPVIMKQYHASDSLIALFIGSIPRPESFGPTLTLYDDFSAAGFFIIFGGGMVA